MMMAEIALRTTICSLHQYPDGSSVKAEEICGTYSMHKEVRNSYEILYENVQEGNCLQTVALMER
jgi:hypothetical protein